MQESENNFSPELIDQQIEHPATSLVSGEAQLIRDLSMMYELEKSNTIDQVWTRLASHRIVAKQQQENSLLQRPSQHTERISVMSKRPATPIPEKRGRRLLNLTAAVLISAVLVVSIALVFSALK